MIERPDLVDARHGAELPEEPKWRYFRAGEETDARPIVASRWLDARQDRRTEEAISPADRWVVSLALRTTRLRFKRDGATLIEGSMSPGTLHVTAPEQRVQAEFADPCDFLHFYVAKPYMDERAAELPQAPERLRDLTTRDSLAAQLGQTLVGDCARGGRLYEETVGQTILTRLLMTSVPTPKVNPLPKWRLRRVQGLIEARMGEAITLSDLAGAAGLSRMHFAAQFRVATGTRPHDYVLQQRIEYAKKVILNENTPLVEAALCAGFQTQSHFSTVFKRITGETPAGWRREQRRHIPAKRPAVRATALPAM